MHVKFSELLCWCEGISTFGLLEGAACAHITRATMRNFFMLVKRLSPQPCRCSCNKAQWRKCLNNQTLKPTVCLHWWRNADISTISSCITFSAVLSLAAMVTWRHKLKKVNHHKLRMHNCLPSLCHRLKATWLLFFLAALGSCTESVYCSRKVNIKYSCAKSHHENLNLWRPKSITTQCLYRITALSF